MQTESAKSVRSFFSKWLSPAQVELLPAQLQTLTIYQLSFLQILQKEVGKVFVETNISTGKSTALILHLIVETRKHGPEGGRVPITLALFPHKTFVQKFIKKLKFFGPLLAQIGCEFFTANENEGQFLEAPRRRVFVGTFGDCIRQFQAERVSLAEVDSIVASDLEYLGSFGQANNFWRLFGFFKTKEKGFLEGCRVVFVGGDEALEETERVRNGFDFEFTVLRVKKEAADGVVQPQPAASKKKKKAEDKMAGVMKAIFNQYFYIGTKPSVFSMLYILLRFELFPEGTLIITDSINWAYLVATFLDRVALGPSKVFNPTHPLALRAYTVALFNAKQTRILVSTTAFLQEMETNKNRISALRGVKNLVFINSSVDYSTYSDYLRLLQGESNYLTGDGNFDLNVLFLVEKTTKLSAAEENDVDEDDEGTYLTAFNGLLAAQEAAYNKVLFEPVFVEEKDVSLFTYRTDNVLQSLTPRQIKTLRAIEMNKVILKSRKMKEYFASHPNERELLLSKLGKLAQSAKKNEVKLPHEIPEYLTPSFLRNSGTRKAQAILAKRDAVKAQKSKEAVPETVEAPQDGEGAGEEPSKERKTKKFSEIAKPNESPETADPSTLKTFSSHKLWKIRHQKIRKSKPDDRRLARKGIYKS